MSVDARSNIIDFLRRELVGPDPVPPHIQANGEEILTNDPPRLRYGVGILFPQATASETSIDSTPEETPEIDEPLNIEDTGTLEVRADNGSVHADEPTEAVDETIPLANAFLPSAMGLSCLLEIPQGGLTVSVRAATYRSEKVAYIGKNGEEKHTLHWRRRPLSASVRVSYDELTGPAIKNTRKHLKLTDGEHAGLEVRFLSRPYRVKDNDQVYRLLTISLVNSHVTRGKSPRNEDCFFQVEMEVTAVNGQSCFLEYPENRGILLDEDERSLAMLYRHQKTYAIGHGCAADWTAEEEGRANLIRSEVLPEYEIKPIVPVQFEDLKLRMFDMSDLGDDNRAVSILKSLCDRYEAWIEEQQAKVKVLAFPHEYLDIAELHISRCRQCLQRMRYGVELLKNDPVVLQAFRLANRAMLIQQLHYGLKLRKWVVRGSAPQPDEPVIWPDLKHPPEGKGVWRPFQIAFILLNLHSLSNPKTPERGIVDLIWFPTGGGKTEAYLGLTAFTILYRRLSNPDNAGTTVLMRYTLRLLTAQQFERAASLICALEHIRDQNPEKLGKEAITLGLWVGGGVTPNKRRDAITEYNALFNSPKQENPFVVLKCPWCGMQMGPIQIGEQSRVMGYQKEANPTTITFCCKDPSCYFGRNRRLPMLVIDEDIYDRRPTLLIATVDKFAMLPWEEKSQRLFGIDCKKVSPPDMIIQDELHLISGPLGAMVGHYETVIQELCTKRDGGEVIRPKIIASTATISRAPEQCHALYNCGAENVFLFPPQCLRAGDSFFAREDSEQPGRVYVGVHASGLPSHITAQVRVMAALLQAPMHLEHEARDPYWTLIGYFNSLRELGHAATLVNADIREYLNTLWLRREIKKPQEGEQDFRRFAHSLLELTSRVPSAKIPGSLQSLMRSYTSTGEEKPVDVCLATNMISVGVDVPRLGVMAVVGQPKTTSEYIQATSRVGRSQRGPGLVVVIYNTGKPRDRSHYEHFCSYHASIYRYVEPTSVTPFAAPVRERALHALMVTLVRFFSPSNLSRPQPFPDESVWKRIREVIEERVTGVDPDELDGTIQLLQRRMMHWQNVLPPRYGDFGTVMDEVPLMYPAGSVPSALWEGRAWPVQSSMRDVDATCNAMVLSAYPGLQE